MSTVTHVISESEFKKIKSPISLFIGYKCGIGYAKDDKMVRESKLSSSNAVICKNCKRVVDKEARNKDANILREALKVYISSRLEKAKSYSKLNNDDKTVDAVLGAVGIILSNERGHEDDDGYITVVSGNEIEAKFPKVDYYRVNVFASNILDELTDILEG